MWPFNSIFKKDCKVFFISLKLIIFTFGTYPPYERLSSNVEFFIARIMAALGPKIYLVQYTFFESGSMKLNSISFDHSFSMASQITNSYYYDDDSGPKKGENYNENLLYLYPGLEATLNENIPFFKQSNDGGRFPFCCTFFRF